MSERLGIWKNALLNRRPIFQSPRELAEAAFAYFDWVENTPVVIKKATHYKGVTFDLEDETTRAMSWKGLRVFLGISASALSYYKSKDGFDEIFEAIEDIMFTQKFEGAAAGVLNATIIQRDLGLAEKTVVEGGDKPVRTITEHMDAKTAMESYEATLNPDK